MPATEPATCDRDILAVVGQLLARLATLHGRMVVKRPSGVNIEESMGVLLGAAFVGSNAERNSHVFLPRRVSRSTRPMMMISP